MADKIFIDTSAFYAYFDRSDSEHRKVSEFMDTSMYDFYTSNYIIDELITLLRYRNFDIGQISSFINELWAETFCSLFYVTPDIEQKAWKMIIKYKEHKLSFTDCTSFIIMRENSIINACSMDKHFKVAGFIVMP